MALPRSGQGHFEKTRSFLKIELLFFIAYSYIAFLEIFKNIILFTLSQRFRNYRFHGKMLMIAVLL